MLIAHNVLLAMKRRPGCERQLITNPPRTRRGDGRAGSHLMPNLPRWQRNRRVGPQVWDL